MRDEWSEIWEEQGLQGLSEHCSTGKPDTSAKIICMRLFTANDNCIVEDVQGRLWRVPKVVNAQGKESAYLTKALELHFGQDGRVVRAIRN